MKKATHQVPFLFMDCISAHDPILSVRQPTGKSGELLLVLVELINHIHHARPDASSRDQATAMTWSRQPHKLSLTILPIMVLKRECVEL